MKHLRPIFCFCTFLVSTLVNAFDFELEGIKYSTADEGVIITGYNSDYTGNIILNGTVDFNGTVYNVVSIGTSAFNNCSNLTNVGNLPACTNIGHWAFQNCTNLACVGDLPACTSIGSGAFYCCSSLNRIGEFSACFSIKDQAFYGCNSLPVIDNIRYANTYAVEAIDKTLSTYTLKEGTRFIGSSAFQSCTSLTNINIPESVSSIGNNAFQNCTSLPVINNIRYADTYAVGTIDKSLSTYTLKEGTRFIGNDAFRNCTSIISINLPESVSSIGQSAFEGCSNLTRVTIPKDLTTIEGCAFFDCTSLASISLPEGITCIESGVFYRCSSLINITIPEDVTTIRSSAFFGCSSLTSISIPEKVNNIENFAFADCTSLTSITCLSVFPPTCQSYTFENVSYTCVLMVPAESIDAYQMSEYWKKFGTIVFSDTQGIHGTCGDNATWTLHDTGELVISGTGAMNNYHSYYGFQKTPWSNYRNSITRVTIEDGVINIGSGSFYECTSLSNLTVSESVNRIEEYAFSGCFNLTSINIPESVTSIENYAFQNCTSLIDIIIPESVTRIASGTFYGCNSLASIHIPVSVTDIEWGAFFGCTNLTNVTLSKGVTSIGNSAFYGCSKLESIICLSTTPPICQTGTFQNVPTSTCVLLVPAESITAYQKADYWKTFATIVPAPTPQCVTPTISYVEGKLKFQCETEGATYQYSITSEIIEVASDEVTLTKQFVITAYAVAEGYTPSEPATLTITLGGGDLNGDGETNVSDVTKLVNIILGNSE